VSPTGLQNALTVSVVFTVFFFPFDRVIAQLIVYGALKLAPHGLSGFANQCAAVTFVEALVSARSLPADCSRPPVVSYSPTYRRLACRR
jgi:hypothetical protein